METLDPNDLLNQWRENPRRISRDQTIDQLIQLICEQREQSEKQWEYYRQCMNQIALLEKTIHSFVEKMTEENIHEFDWEGYQKALDALHDEVKAIKQALVAQEKSSEARSNEIEESITKDLMEVMDAHFQAVQQDHREFQGRLDSHEESIKDLEALMAGMHPTAELFVLELATAINAWIRVAERSRQVSFVLGARKADLFQQDAEDEADDRDSKE